MSTISQKVQTTVRRLGLFISILQASICERAYHLDFRSCPRWRYHHNRTGEDNADAHHKRQIMGREVVVAVTDGRLDLGPWEQIFYGEFDGRRPKRIMVKIIGE